jgi:hypothetical protein
VRDETNYTCFLLDALIVSLSFMDPERKRFKQTSLLSMFATARAAAAVNVTMSSRNEEDVASSTTAKGKMHIHRYRLISWSGTWEVRSTCIIITLSVNYENIPYQTVTDVLRFKAQLKTRL